VTTPFHPIFDRVCDEHGIEHRLTKIKHPWTNGQVERMNRTIKEATVKRYHYDSHAQLGSHLHDFIDAYNYGRRLKTLRGLTPYEYICKCWTSEPDRFNLNPHHQMPGPNSYTILPEHSINVTTPNDLVRRNRRPFPEHQICVTRRRARGKARHDDAGASRADEAIRQQPCPHRLSGGCQSLPGAAEFSERCAGGHVAGIGRQVEDVRTIDVVSTERHRLRLEGKPMLRLEPGRLG
jgi:hypothetical protein